MIKLFDPSAYENLKVVLEGLVYDYDLSGEIVVIERNDIVNLADFSRRFNLVFTHKNDRHEHVLAKIELSSSFKQIASEWIPLNEQPGAALSIQFNSRIEMNEILEKRLVKHLKQQYSSDYNFEWIKLQHSNQTITYEFTLHKYHHVTERTVDDLSKIVEKVIETLNMVDDMVHF